MSAEMSEETILKLAEALSKVNKASTSSSPSSAAPEVAAVSLKLPEFWPEDPEVWFLRVEAQLRAKSIVGDQTKFDYVVAALDNRAAVEVKAVLSNPPNQNRYETLKKALFAAFGKSQAQKDMELLQISGLGDRKPTALLRHLESLNNDAETLRRAFFLAQLPAQVRAILALQEFTSLNDLASAADRIVEAGHLGLQASVAPVSTATENIEAVSANLRLSGGRFVCYYHQRFGPNANKCKPGCLFQSKAPPKAAPGNQGNLRAGRR